MVPGRGRVGGRGRDTNGCFSGARRGRVSIEWANDLSPIAAADWNGERAAHLLERAGFGGTPEEIARLAAMTPQQAVDCARRLRIDRRAI